MTTPTNIFTNFKTILYYEKQRLKKLLKIGILLFGISLILTNCQKDDNDILNETFQEKRLKRISLTDLNSRIGNSTSFNNLKSLFDVNKVTKSQYQQRLESTDEAWLITDEIVMIERDNAVFYTFKIGTNTIGNEFYNLVVAINDIGEIVTMHIY